jgi:hypothetical protein
VTLVPLSLSTSPSIMPLSLVGRSALAYFLLAVVSCCVFTCDCPAIVITVGQPVTGLCEPRLGYCGYIAPYLHDRSYQCYVTECSFVLECGGGATADTCGCCLEFAGAVNGSCGGLFFITTVVSQTRCDVSCLNRSTHVTPTCDCVNNSTSLPTSPPSKTCVNVSVACNSDATLWTLNLTTCTADRAQSNLSCLSRRLADNNMTPCSSNTTATSSGTDVLCANNSTCLCNDGAACVGNITPQANPPCTTSDNTTVVNCTTTTTTSVDACDSSPCLNDGTHRSFPGGYNYTCDGQFTGDYRSVRLRCFYNPCRNNGTCTESLPDGYNCTGVSDFTGVNCSTPPDPCSSGPRFNDGTCVSTASDGFSCLCAVGWTGNNRSLNSSECASGLWLNGGQCSDIQGGFNCACSPGFTGVTCSSVVVGVTLTCQSQPCVNGGTCQDTTDGYTRNCLTGYYSVNCTQCNSSNVCNGQESSSTLAPIYLQESTTSSYQPPVALIVGLTVGLFFLVVLIAPVIFVTMHRKRHAFGPLGGGRSTHGHRGVDHMPLPVLHLIEVLLFSCLFLYLLLSVLILVCHPAENLPLEPPQPYRSFFHRYQPVPCSSVISTLDKLSHYFFCNCSCTRSILSTGFLRHLTTTPSSHAHRYRHALFLFTLLVTFAGDINLNPGPPHPIHNTPSSLSFSHLNTRSVTSITSDINKPTVLQDFITSNNIDIMTISETWLTIDTLPSVLNSLTPPGYSFAHIPRKLKIGGGVAILHRSTFKTIPIPIPTFSSFEAMATRLSLPSSSLLIITVYRPPSSSKTDFLTDFATLLEHAVSQPSEIIITGDFNFQLNYTTSHSDANLITLLDTFNLTQHITFPTHSAGHTLDLLITRESSNLVSSVTFADPGLSDHLAIISTLSIRINKRPASVTKTTRCFRKIDIASFKADILSSSITSPSLPGAEAYLDHFNSTLTSILDKHAPLKTFTCSNRTNKPYFSQTIRLEKAKRAKLETRYRRTRSPIDQQNYKTQAHYVAKLITSARRSYFKSLIANSAKNPKELWATLDLLLSRSSPKTLPHSLSPSMLASDFVKFFGDKITQLTSAFPTPSTPFIEPTPTLPPPLLANFTLASPDEVRSTILSSSDASCTLDVIPTFLLKSCLDTLLDPITSLVNLSLTEGIFPTAFKHAIVTPKLKKPSLPKDDLASYRPISNLNFISKVLERVIHNRLNSHLITFPSLSPFQSAYRKYHSTETALLKISNDLLTACNQQKVSALVLLDLSAAFDTIDHQILLSRLSTTFGVSGTSLNLLTSYLSNRSQSVSIEHILSPSHPLTTGVPQGSVLGPLLFCLYTTPLATLFQNSPVASHFFADDSQCYTSFTSVDAPRALAQLSSTLDLAFQWFISNRLSINPSKTEYLLVGTPQQLLKIHSPSLNFQGNSLAPSDHVRNLGVIFDSNLSFKNHISSICQSCFYHIRQLRQVRPSLDTNSAIILANALVSTKLDYCNSLLNSLPMTSLNRLQHVQNALARAVEPSVKFRQHITPTLLKLHWLRIEKRITYKIASLTFKTLRYSQPTYLNSLLHSHTPTRSLRSSHLNLLVIPSIKSSIGRRSFSFAAPTIWNSLPHVLRSPSISPNQFFSQLKTHLFDL